MQNPDFVRKMIFLVILLCVVLGIFFIQQQQIISPGPQPTPVPISSREGNIIVTSPYKDAPVPPDFIIQGKARVYENVVSLRVSSKLLGKVYYDSYTIADATDAGSFGNFTARISLDTSDFSLKPNDKLTLEVYQASPKDGSALDVVTIPLIFSPELP